MGIQDRRAHPRFAVDEQARLSIVEHGRAMQCRILDLSLEGCRVCAGGSLPQGLQARVEVTFTINGIPLRMAGRIMRSDGTGELGIRFADVSGHRQAEWAEVVNEVQAIAIAAERARRGVETGAVGPEAA